MEFKTEYHPAETKTFNPLDPENAKGLNPYFLESCFKKCCKKYKKGKRCKSCPKR